LSWLCAGRTNTKRVKTAMVNVLRIMSKNILRKDCVQIVGLLYIRVNPEGAPNIEVDWIFPVGESTQL
jgi:hypothetical protein